MMLRLNKSQVKPVKIVFVSALSAALLFNTRPVIRKEEYCLKKYCNCEPVDRESTKSKNDYSKQKERTLRKVREKVFLGN